MELDTLIWKNQETSACASHADRCELSPFLKTQSYRRFLMDKNKWLKTGIIITVVIFLILISSAILKHATIHQVYFYYVDSIHHLTGLNKYLIKTAVLLSIIPFIIGLRWYFFSPINKKLRYTGAAILIAIMILFNLSLYYFTRSSYFAFSEGKVLKWYASTPEGVRFYDAPGYDPKYGLELKQATPELIANLEKTKRGMQPKRLAYDSINEIELFDPITGENKVWYFMDQSGNYELFDSAGVHPVYGEALKPITKQVISQIKAKLDEDARKKQEEALKIEQQRQEEAKRQEEQRLTQEHEAFLNRYLMARSFTNNPESLEVAVLVIDEDNTISQDVTQKIALSLKNERCNVTSSLFTGAFVSDGIFEKIFGGDTGKVKNLELSKYRDLLILGKKEVNFTENPELQNMTTAKVSIEIHIVSLEAGTIEDNFKITETGAGFSKETAEGMAMERILQVISPKILETFNKEATAREK